MAITPRRFLSSITLASVITTVALIGASLFASAGCDDAFEPPCEVAATEVLVRDPAIGVGDAISLTRSFDEVIATWQRRALDAGASARDAGASDADAEPPNEAPLVTELEVALMDATSSALVSRATIPAPRELRQRRSSVEDIGIIPEDDQTFLVHWKELSFRTDAVGRLVRGASLKTVYVTNGVASEVRTIAQATCDRCRLAVSFTTLQSETLLFVRADDDRTDVPLGTPFAEPRFAVVRLRRDGTTLTEPTPWLRLPLVPSGDGGTLVPQPIERTGDSIAEPPARPELATSIDGEGRIAILAGPRAWLADSSPRLIRGPILLPSAPDSRLSWQEEGSEPGRQASLAWSVSPTTEGRGRDPAKREIFTGIVPSDGAVVVTRERTSLGRTTLGFDRRGDDLGVIFESDQRVLFAWLDPAGKKRGADLLVGAQAGVARGEFGYPIIPNKHLLFARGGGRFTTLTLGFGELTSKEIRCVAKRK